MFGTSTNTAFSKLDKDRLYNVMSDLIQDYQHHLDLDYGNPFPEVEQAYWESNPGEEIFALSPSSTPLLQDTLNAILESSDFKLLYAHQELGLRVRHDIFSKLPYDLIYKISCLLPPQTLLDLSKASWEVNFTLRNNDSFWIERIRSDMPWFFELQETLDNPDAMQGKNYKGLFMWADKITTPKLWMSGPFMGLANRRRIWTPCQQLRNKYLRWEPKPEPEVIEPQKIETIAYWFHSWEDVHKKAKVLEIFWSSDGFLVGISVAPDNDRRLLGQDDETTGVSKQVVEIERGVWLTGIILHIPTIQNLLGGDHSARDNVNTFVKGLTVCYYCFNVNLTSY